MFAHSAPLGRTAPRHVIEGLRRIDRTAELLYLGEGRWVLGTVDDNQARRQKGATLLNGIANTIVQISPLDEHWQKVVDRIWQRRTWAKLMYHGFSAIAAYQCVGDPDEFIVRDFAVRNFNWIHAADETFEARLDESDKSVQAEKREAANRDDWRQRQKEWFGLKYLGRKQFNVTREVRA